MSPAGAANWDTIQGQWKQAAGKVKEKWGKLTDNEITEINGKREQLEGRLQERYGYTKEQVKKEVDDWLNGM
ncbi:CsbD family protein [Methylocystis sp. 9N]|uniref:CsbD family protein n=1 Tax=Methylocystis borbori TaxID=3118750 RepID=A0ABU7XGZ6_9HYPH